MNADKIHEVVRELVGKIKPVGDSAEDAKRLNNLKDYARLIRLMIEDVTVIGIDNISQQHLMKVASDYSKRFLLEIKDQITHELQSLA